MNIRGLSATVIACTIFSIPAYADNHGMDDKKTVAELVATSDEHTVLETALEESGLSATLNGKGPYTLLAPTDEAFDALPEGTLDSLLMSENSDKLESIVGYHVVEDQLIPGSMILMLIEAGDTRGSVTMLNGEQLFINKESDGSVTLEDADGNKTSVIKADLKASNGVVHVIDHVLMP